ncbi:MULTISPECIES: hypothetical protein [unclassified Micromonospora]|uniref:hypothetical protein n=1 Tax=unclassified Micromonospora TaxID=2617518 RepID=UPI001C21DEB7|nr:MULTISPECIES: hypothetical protein [unclassified Micromonospora]MBU8857680.1 hypothetical protein [Micromonospora sp. WMMB482]MDM4783307.1 hypothetical protein [Micromonospora sp. b486]
MTARLLTVARTPAFIADVIAQVTAGHDRPGTGRLAAVVNQVAREHGLPATTVRAWLTEARYSPQAPLPYGLLHCGLCSAPLATITRGHEPPVFLCTPPCGRNPIAADGVSRAVAAIVLRRAPRLVPPGSAADAASYARAVILRINVGATLNDLRVTWRSAPPRTHIAQRLHAARRHTHHRNHRQAVRLLRGALHHIDPLRHRPTTDLITARAAALLADTSLAARALGAREWAAFAHRSLRGLHGDPTHPEVRDALAVLAAATTAAGDHTGATRLYSDLIRYHSQAEGPAALPTLTAQAHLCAALHATGQVEQAASLLRCTAAALGSTHHHDPATARLAKQLAAMRDTARPTMPAWTIARSSHGCRSDHREPPPRP